MEGSIQEKLLLTLKLRQLQAKGFEGITFEELQHIFIKYIWRHNYPSHISTLADSIFGMSDDMIVRLLSVESKVLGSKQALEDVLDEIDTEASR